MKDSDIKDIWKDGDLANDKAYTSTDVDQMISKGSHGVIQRFLKTLFWEQHLNLIILSSLAIELFWEEEWIVGIGTLFFNFAFYLYYLRLRKNLKKEAIDTSVLEYLYRVQKIIGQFMTHLKIASVIILLLAIWAAYHLNNHGFYDDVMEPDAFWIGIIVGMIIALPITFYLIHLMYGKKAKKLAHMICSLEKEEN
ncbi:hypothetical protein [Reichenbachiella sp.]|uniref:hypothetical protein n=1 Tax=Reichenbachiella sp. TaxID=2184521 RepID=UPI003BAE7D6E